MKSLAHTLAILLALSGPAFGQAASTTTVPGQLLTSPLNLPNSVLFGSPATISSNGQATFGSGSTIGATIIGQGSVNDFTLKNKSGSNVCTVATGTTIFGCASIMATAGGANALTVGPNGTTNPAFNVNDSASSSATGLGITSAAAGSGLALAVTSSGTNEALTLNAKGSGMIGIGTVSTGAITLGAPVIISGASFTATGLVTQADLKTPTPAWFNVNNYASLSAALTAASGVGCVYIPGGTTVSISAAVTLPANTCIVGDGVTSVIQQTTASANTINVPNAGALLENFIISYSSQGTASSSGIYVTSTNGSGIAVNTIRNVTVYQAYFGLQTSGTNSLYVITSNFINSTAAGGVINNSVNVFMENDYIVGPTSPGPTLMSLAGLYIENASEGNSIHNVEIYGTVGGNLAFYCGSVAYSTCPNENIFSGDWMDNSLAEGGGYCYNCLFVGNWFSGYEWGSNGNGNVYVGNTFSNSNQHGFILAGGVHTVVTGNNFISNGSGCGTSCNGISVIGGVTDFNITNNNAYNESGSGGGTQGYGINVLSGSSNRYVITGNLVTSNVTGGVNDGGSGSNKTVSGNW